MRNLFKVFVRNDGARFNGHLTNSASVSNSDRPTYRVLHVRRPSFVKPGDLIRTMGGEWIVLMAHPDYFNWAETFKATYVKDVISWIRPIKVEDPVAHVMRDSTERDMGPLYVNFDTPQELKLEGLSETGYRFITGQDVWVGDLVGGKMVKRIHEMAGVRVVFAT